MDIVKMVVLVVVGSSTKTIFQTLKGRYKISNHCQIPVIYIYIYIYI